MSHRLEGRTEAMRGVGVASAGKSPLYGRMFWRRVRLQASGGHSGWFDDTLNTFNAICPKLATSGGGGCAAVPIRCARITEPPRGALHSIQCSGIY